MYADLTPIEGRTITMPCVGVVEITESDESYSGYGREFLSVRRYMIPSDLTRPVPTAFLWHGVQISALALYGAQLAHIGGFPAHGLAWAAAVEAGRPPSIAYADPRDVGRYRPTQTMPPHRFGAPNEHEGDLVGVHFTLVDEVRIEAGRAYRAWLAANWHRLPIEGMPSIKAAPLAGDPVARITTGLKIPDRHAVEARGVFADVRTDAMPGSVEATVVGSTKNGKWSTIIVDVRLGPDARLWTATQSAGRWTITSSDGIAWSWESGTLRGLHSVHESVRAAYAALFPAKVKEWAEM